MDSAITETFSTSVATAGTQIMAMIGIGLTAGLGVVITIWAIRKGIDFFRKLLNKGN